MATQVVMPKLSPTMEEGQLSKWLKKEGDKVSAGEPLAEVETDKASMEMQALGNGVLRKILLKEGETVPLGQIIAIIGEPDEDISELLAKAGSEAGATTKAQETSNESSAAESDRASEQESTTKMRDDEKQPQAAPKDINGEDDQGKDAGKVSATQDKQSARGDQTATAASSGNGSDAKDAGQTGKRLIVSPLAARMAAEAGINLSTLTGSGPGGRIVKRDIETAMTSTANPAAQTTSTQEAPQRHLRAIEASTAQQQPAQKSSIVGASAYRDEPMTEMRRTIARRLITSIGPVPHFFLTTEIEMDRAADMRRSIKDLDPELKISINDIIIKVAAAALMQHPQVNASFQEKAIRFYECADIGVAVAIEDGLITPVVRSADKKSLSEISSEVHEMAERARLRKLRPEEFTGATFSISNLGMFGIDEFTAVINPPEAAILAVGAMTPKPVARDGEMVVVRQLMRVTMSCDHRVIDGATGARFLQTFKRMLENPLYLLV